MAMIPLRDDNPTSPRPLLTVNIIVTRALVFVWQLRLGSAVELAILRYGVTPGCLLGESVLPPDSVPVCSPS